jgi:Probable zinc-ribbon domain
MKVSELISELHGDKDPKKMPMHFFYGSRHLDYKTAQLADVSKQHCTVCPRHWYIDATFVCCDCDHEFIFTASEQRFWYEDMWFFIDSLPKRCVQCRKAERTRLDLRKHYDALIAEALSQCVIETKKQTIEIINELEVAEGQIPERMVMNRLTLYAQLARAAGQF